MNKSKKNNPVKSTGQGKDQRNLVCNCKHPRYLHIFGYCRGNRRDGGCTCRAFTTKVKKTIKRRKKNKVSPEILAEMK